MNNGSGRVSARVPDPVIGTSDLGCVTHHSRDTNLATHEERSSGCELAKCPDSGIAASDLGWLQAILEFRTSLHTMNIGLSASSRSARIWLLLLAILEIAHKILSPSNLTSSAEQTGRNDSQNGRIRLLSLAILEIAHTVFHYRNSPHPMNRRKERFAKRTKPVIATRDLGDHNDWSYAPRLISAIQFYFQTLAAILVFVSLRFRSQSSP